MGSALQKNGGMTAKAVDRWYREMPREEEMLPKDKYTIFDRKERKYRKGIHSKRILLIDIDQELIRRKNFQNGRESASESTLPGFDRGTKEKKLFRLLHRPCEALILHTTIVIDVNQVLKLTKSLTYKILSKDGFCTRELRC